MYEVLINDDYNTVNITETEILEYIKLNKSKIKRIDKKIDKTNATHKKGQETINIADPYNTYDMSSMSRDIISEFANYISIPNMYGTNPISPTDIKIAAEFWKSSPIYYS